MPLDWKEFLAPTKTKALACTVAYFIATPLLFDAAYLLLGCFTASSNLHSGCFYPGSMLIANPLFFLFAMVIGPIGYLVNGNLLALLIYLKGLALSYLFACSFAQYIKKKWQKYKL